MLVINKYKNIKLINLITLIKKFAIFKRCYIKYHSKNKNTQIKKYKIDKTYEMKNVNTLIKEIDKAFKKRFYKLLYKF